MTTQMTFKCWKCEKIFTHPVHINQQSETLVHCSQCGTPCAIRLDGYKQPLSSLTKSIQPDIVPLYEWLITPGTVIPTHKP